MASVILSGCKVYKDRLGARACTVGEVDSKTEKAFLNHNHLQGYHPSSLCYGLFYRGSLVSLMSFVKPRFNKKTDWELLRFCNKLNTQVVGGASRLFSRRPKGSIVSYSDSRLSLGHLYENLGFVRQFINSPGYYYTNDYQTFYSRVKFQKHKLPKILEIFDPFKTEWENMQANGFDRIWDCGTTTWIYYNN